MFQFIRAEVYARRASTNPKSKSEYSAADIIGEALRDEGHCPHVENPEPPRYLIGSEAETRAMLDRINENASKYRDPVGRKMREDAAVLLAGVASFPRAEAEKTRTLCAMGIADGCLSPRKVRDNLRAVVMHNDEEHPHLHFYVYSDTEVNAKMLHDGHKNASRKGSYKAGVQAFQNEYFEKVASRCGMARTGPKRRRLSRAEWHAEQEMSMSIAKAESAVLDSAATKEKEAHKRLQAVQEHAELLAKEKRATREAMQKALALQAEAREKIAQSEALLAQYGLADVAPQPTPAPEASKAAPIGEFGL